MQNHCSIEHVVLLIMKKNIESLVTEDKAKTLGKRKSSLRGFLSCHFSFPCLYRIRSYNFICMVFCIQRLCLEMIVVWGIHILMYRHTSTVGYATSCIQKEVQYMCVACRKSKRSGVLCCVQFFLAVALALFCALALKNRSNRTDR